MTMKYDSRSCTISQNWEWVQGSGSGGSKTVTVSGISVSAYQDWAWDGGSWNSVGSMVVTTTTHSYSDADGYSGDIPIQSHNATVSPPSYSGTTFDERIRTYGGGTGTFSGTVYKTVSYYWGASGSPTNNASTSIHYDDGTYAGTLYLDSVSGSPSAPSYSGSYIGQTDSTSTSGTAYYSGDVPLKGSGELRPNNWTWSSLVPSAWVYFGGGILRANVVNATEWDNFCARINEFRQFRSLSNYNFTVATTGGSLTYSMTMEAVNAINDMVPVSMGVGPYSTLVNLKDALNSI